MIRFLHLSPKELGLNGERGNLDTLAARLRWDGIESEVIEHENGRLPSHVDAVFIGSGTLAGALSALENLKPNAQALREISDSGVPFLALGLGWEILGATITLENSETINAMGVYPSASRRVAERASRECFGYVADQLTTGYANHSAEIELESGVSPWIHLESGNGNSSLTQAPKASGEGLRTNNLFAARLNGPLLPLNPHLADEFLNAVCERSGIIYKQDSPEAKVVDGYAKRAREELRSRLVRK